MSLVRRSTPAFFMILATWCLTVYRLTQRRRAIRVDQLFFHLVAGPKMKLLGWLIVFIDDAAIRSGELNRPSDYSAEHSLEIKSRADGLAHFPQGFELSNGPR